MPRVPVIGITACTSMIEQHATQTIEQLAFRNERNSRLIAKG